MTNYDLAKAVDAFPSGHPHREPFLAELRLRGSLGPEAQEEELHKAARRGNPDALRRWYEAGARNRIKWGVPGDFIQCVKIAKKYMTDKEAKGFCQLRHMSATGEPAGVGAHGGKKKTGES